MVETGIFLHLGVTKTESMQNYYSILFLLFFGWIADAQTITFADNDFRDQLIAGACYDINQQFIADLDLNDDGEIQVSEAQAVYGIDSPGFGISSLGGIEFFTNLRNFTFQYGESELNVIDLSMLPVENIHVSTANIFNLNYNAVTLRTIDIQMTSLDVFDTSGLAGNTQLVSLNLAHNHLSSIDLAPLQSCTNLSSLVLYDNVLTSLDWSPLANNTNITEINASSNQIGAFDFSQVNTAVNRINLSNNQLSALDFTLLNHPLQALHVENNPYDYFDTAGLAHIDTLMAGSDALHDAKFTVYDFDYVGLMGDYINSIDFKNGQNESCFTISHTCALLPGGQRFYTVRNPNQIICTDDYPNFSEDAPLFMDKSERNYWSLTINGEDEFAEDPLTGPHITAYCSEEPGGGYHTIVGNVKYDCGNANTNLFQVPIRMVENSLESATTTNASGDFRLYTIQNNVTVTPDLQNLPFFNVTPANYTYSFPSMGNTETANFCLTPNGVHHDVEVSLYPISNARPGFDAGYVIVYKNNGNQIASGNVTFNFNDAIADFVNANPTLGAQNGNVLTWNYANLAPFESRNIYVTLNFNSPMETPPVNLGDELTFTAQANVDQTDEMPADNEAIVHQTVIGSFDPNDKQVAEGSQIHIDDADEYLHYIIRFENTGTASAENVAVEDYLESDLDPSTLEVVSASHPYRATLTDGNQFEVFFTGINLPASIDSESESHGYVAFKIKPKNTVTVGTEIKNKANIHFDFNFPIVTNTTSTTFTLLGTKDFTASGDITVYPNPAQNQLNIRNNGFENILSVRIYNMLGQLMYRNYEAQREWHIDVSGLQTGSYLVRMATESAVSTQHFVKK